MKRTKIIFFILLIFTISSLIAMERGPIVFSVRPSAIKQLGDGPGSKIKMWGGFAVGRNLSDHLYLGFDGSVGWTRPWGETNQRFITYLIPINFNAVYYFLNGKIHPLVTAGVGMLYWDLRNVTYDTSNHSVFQRFGYPVYGAMQRDATVNSGVGLCINLTKALDFDIYTRYHHIVEQNMDMSGLGEYHKGILEAGLAFTLNFNFTGPKDSDGDGILDKYDKCPNEPEDFDGYQDDDGCPDPDNDGDGIPDIKDKCPNKPEDKDGYQDDDGCPDLDNDGDGIPDTKDKCPNKPETFNGYQDDDGCPDVKPAPKPKVIEKPKKPAPKKEVKKVKPKIYRLKYINFEVNSYNLTDRARKELDKFAESIKAYPNAELFVKGYTDNTGSKSYNIMLSKKRANAVREYLITKGIPAFRIKADGYGPANPIASNKTREGRAQNRRIEIELTNIK